MAKCKDPKPYNFRRDNSENHTHLYYCHWHSVFYMVLVQKLEHVQARAHYHQENANDNNSFKYELDNFVLLLLLLFLFFFLFLFLFLFFFFAFTRIDIDECASNVHDCHSSASCTNTAGSFSCSCNNPYTGDGKTCSHSAAGKPLIFILCCREMLDIPYFRFLVKSNMLYFMLQYDIFLGIWKCIKKNIFT